MKGKIVENEVKISYNKWNGKENRVERKHFERKQPVKI